MRTRSPSATRGHGCHRHRLPPGPAVLTMTHCALRATTNADGTGNRLAAIGAKSHSAPASKLAPGMGTPRQPFGFPGPVGHEPRQRRDTKYTKSPHPFVAARSALRSPAVPPHPFVLARSTLRAPAVPSPLFVKAAKRPFSCPREAGVRVRQAMGLEESRRVVPAAGGEASRPATRPAANRRSRSIALTAFVIARSANALQS